ncbi:MAG: RNA polymerase sigma factor SigJ [bacterium]|nr:RNA polymerase sigma factor SigJ [bacterium]
MTEVDRFESERQFLSRLAYRLLGSVADAEDVVQEAFLRWRSADRADVADPRAWLTRACTRLCLDRIRATKRQREQYVGEWLPEPLIEDGTHELDETLSMALLRTVERLPATERASFLLHDVFGYEFTEVAAILDLQPANCRQLAARARRNLRTGRRRRVDATTVRRLSEAFFAAIGDGDLDRLHGVLAEDVVLYSDGGGKVPAARIPVVGVGKVANFFVAVFAREPDSDFDEVWFNGAPGIVVRQAGRPVSAFQFDVVDGRIAGIYVQRNPDKLGVLWPSSP